MLGDAGGAVAGLSELHCSQCQRVSDFEQPDCSDAHGGDCPEWVCVLCGNAIFAGLTPRPAPRSVQSTDATQPGAAPLRRTA
jgi:hypothetical protein